MPRGLSLASLAVMTILIMACGGTQSPPEQQAASTPAPPEAVAQAAPPPPAMEPPASAQAPAATPPRPAQPQPMPPLPKPTATASRPPAPPKPTLVEVPTATVLEMELATALSTKTSKAGDAFQAKLIDPVTVGGQVVIPEGSVVEGTVTEAISANKMTGQASLSLQFSKLTIPSGESVAISGMLSQKGKKIGKRTAGVIGGSAAAGAILGRIIGKDTKGAVVGAAAGAAIGTGVAASQKGQDLDLPVGAGLSIELQGPVEVPVPPRGA